MKRFLTVAVLALSATPAAFAADIIQRGPSTANYLAPAPASEWVITLGAEARVGPRYEGSSDLRLLPFPVFPSVTPSVNT